MVVRVFLYVGQRAHFVARPVWRLIPGVTAEAVELGRNGGGPTALEADVVRFDGHFIGDPQLYRAKGEIKQLRKDRDCLKIFRKRVTAEGWLKAGQLNTVDKEVAALIELAVEQALAAPHPEIESLMTDVYCSY